MKTALQGRVAEGKSTLEGDELEIAAKNIGYGELVVVVVVIIIQELQWYNCLWCGDNAMIECDVGIWHVWCWYMLMIMLFGWWGNGEWIIVIII